MIFQVFFHKYFTMKHAREKAKASKVERRKGDVDGLESGSDADDGDGETAGEKVGAECSQNEQDSDLDEGEIWKVRNATRPAPLRPWLRFAILRPCKGRCQRP
jgi:ribosome biogenesis protein MAK21